MCRLFSQNSHYGGVHLHVLTQPKIYETVYLLHADILVWKPLKGLLANSEDPDQMPHSAQNVASDHSVHCCYKLTRHPAIGNTPVQRVVVEESTQYKWDKHSSRNEGYSGKYLSSEKDRIHTIPLLKRGLL